MTPARPQSAAEIICSSPNQRSSVSEEAGENSGNAGRGLSSRAGKIFDEAVGLVRAPQRTGALLNRIFIDALRLTFDQRHLYSYANSKTGSMETLDDVVNWILDAQRADGGVPAYYSLCTGYSASYPEVTGYIIPTLYDFVRRARNGRAHVAAQRATGWLLSQQMPTGAFPAGFQDSQKLPSVFNTGQILHGLICAYMETRDPHTRNAAIAAGNWLMDQQEQDGSWAGPAAYQNFSHTYYSMVAWALAALSAHLADERYACAAERNLDWLLPYFQANGWIAGINLHGHPTYLHFIAYVLQGALECAEILRRTDVVDAAANSAWILLRKFETNKFLAGAYDPGFKNGRSFACLTGNAQMSCVWLRLFEITGDVRYLNASLKMNEMLKALIPRRGRKGIAGGVAGSYPIWGRYQPLRFISWGNKFFADALLLEARAKESFEATSSEVLACAS
jgi:Prenyltransferase and squalene oxidase repeat